MWLGIDVGTGSVKARLFGERGEERGAGRAALSVASPGDGGAETDATTWWDAVVQAVRAATRDAEEPVRAIGLSGQMHGVVLTDAAGRPLRPAVLWADTRSAAQLESFRSLPESVRDELANPIVTGMAGPTLLWLREHERSAYDDARWALQPKDWLRFRLVGEAATDPTDASATLLWDVPGDTWHDHAIERLGLRRSLFAPVVASQAAAGSLLPDAAGELGLPAGIPVATGAADTAAAIHGAGLEVGDVQVTVGSGGQCVHVTDSLDPAPERGVHVFRAVEPGRWYRMGAIQNAGVALEWARSILALSWDEMHDALRTVPPGSDGLTFLPYVTGERTPHLDPDARAAWVHAGRHHGREHFARAALEGVAFAFGDAFDALFPGSERPELVRLAGGGSTDPAWRQLLADALQAMLMPADVEDASVRGAAILAAEATGEAWPEPSEGPDARRIEPSDAEARLAAARERFKVAYRALRS